MVYSHDLPGRSRVTLILDMPILEIPLPPTRLWTWLFLNGAYRNEVPLAVSAASGQPAAMNLA